MKSFIKQISYFLIMFLFAGFTACGGGGGDSTPAAASGDLLTKITPLVEAAVPKYTISAEKTGPSKSWSEFSEGSDPHLARYLGPDDGCSLFSNVEFYDVIVNFINSKVNSSFESSDSNVTITSRTSLTIPAWGGTSISGDFHDINFGGLSFTPEVYGGDIELKNIRLAVEKTSTSERVYIFIDVYYLGVRMTLSSARFEKTVDVFSYEERYFENGTSGHDGEGHIFIEKAADDSFIIKRLYYNDNATIDRAVVTGNFSDNFYIRVSNGSVATDSYAWNVPGGVETFLNIYDECFEVKSSDFTKQYPAGTDGTKTNWTGGVFPSDVNDGNFTGFDVRDLITDQNSNFQWW